MKKMMQPASLCRQKNKKATKVLHVTPQTLEMPINTGLPWGVTSEKGGTPSHTPGDTLMCFILYDHNIFVKQFLFVHCEKISVINIYVNLIYYS